MADRLPGVTDELKQPEERLSLDLLEADFLFLTGYAKLRNSIAALEKRNIKRWTRKALAEDLLRLQIQGLRQQLSERLDALGPIPTDDKAMREYAARWVALDKRAGK